MTTKAQQKRNCRYLAKKLQAIPREHYDQNTYYRHIGKHAQDKPAPFDCKTKACSWGHAACMPYFNKQGLFFYHDGLGWEPNLHQTSSEGRSLFGMSDYIARTIFGLSNEVGSRYKPQAVADKLLAHAKTL